MASLRNIAPSLVSLVSEAAHKKTPLYDEHMRLGAKMVPFAGWLMPVQYTSIVEEHQAVRNNVGVFDISHMGQFIVEGANARGWLNSMLTNNIYKLEVGMGQYTFLLNDRGGIIDDLIVYRIDEQEYLLVVNAACADKDFAWLQQHLKEGRSPDHPGGNWKAAAPCTLTSRSANFGAVAIQGPQTMALFHALFGKEIEQPARNHIIDVPFDTTTASVARTGYTGEDGIEVFFPANVAVKFWSAVLERGKALGIKPCGLGARDTLRLEMCYPLNGSDLSPERNPIEAGLGFFVDLAKPDFVGRDAPGKAADLAETLAFREKRLTAPQRPFGSLLAAQIEHERDTFVPTSIFEECAAEKYGHSAAIFPEVLLLEGLKNAGCF